MPSDQAFIDMILRNSSSKDVLKANPKSPLAQLLDLQVKDIIKELRKSLVKYDANASRHLAQEIKPTKASVKGSEVSIQIEAPFYWKFINYGVNGTLVNRGAPNWGAQPKGQYTFSQSMKNWEKHRGVTYSNGQSNWISKSHVEGMGLKERGQIARPFYSDVVNDALIRELEEPISKLMKQAITIRIVEPWQ
jgi:hypothetical protein